MDDSPTIVSIRDPRLRGPLGGGSAPILESAYSIAVRAQGWSLQNNAGGLQTWVSSLGWVHGQPGNWQAGYHGQHAIQLHVDLDKAKAFITAAAEDQIAKAVESALQRGNDDDPDPII